jgi:hypothetical protein
MALIKQIKNVEKSFIKIPASKHLADSFNKELDNYQKSSQSNNVLDFDILVKKLIDELTKINSSSSENLAK